ncbi:MAG: DUF72 domain-containing protein [Burkholderiales bacterium]|nr:DUF72 domain-containing protein [Burkholderiales bacterium]
MPRAPGPSPLFDEGGDAASAGAGAIAPAPSDEDLRRLGRALPDQVYLGTSSWSFGGWSMVYGRSYSESSLSRQGLTAYAAHPVLRAVGIDRSFYQPLPQREYERYAAQVPPTFRFLVKAPALVADALVRAHGTSEGGAGEVDNPSFLDADLARECFVEPALRGLGERAGPLVFQLSPLPWKLTRGEAAHATIERIGAFLAALPTEVDGRVPTFAVELRNAELLTPRLVRTLREVNARLCLGIHARMPPAARQSAALRAMDAEPAEGDDWRLKGPLVVRWSLHAGLRYDDAKNRYAPFDRLLDADIPTRGTLAHLIHVAIKSAQPAYVIVNNKAEGSAPLSCVELARAVVHKAAP